VDISNVLARQKLKERKKELSDLIINLRVKHDAMLKKEFEEKMALLE